MKIYYDGVHKVTYTGIWVPQVAEWLWLSTGASFGDIGTFADEPVGWLTSAKVDYVRVWQYAGNPVAGPLLLVGGSLLNGDFNANPGGSVSFAETDYWYNTKGLQSQVATLADKSYDGSQNGSMTSIRGFGSDTGHSIVEGDCFDFSYVWKDDWNWVDASDQVTVSLFVTSDNTFTGTRTNLLVDHSGLRQVNDAYEAVAREAVYTAVAADAGKTLFAAIETTSGGFARIDNFVLSVNPPFKTWIASYGLDPGQQGLSDDPDGDGIPNGFEAWFGTHPGEFSTGITGVGGNGLNFTFNHPMSVNPPADLSASYLWSPDLIDWYAGDGVDGPAGGATVLFEVTITEQAAQVTGTPDTEMDQMFSRIALEGVQ